MAVFVIGAVFGIFALMPSSDVVAVALESNAGLLDSFADYIHCACYLLPMGTVQTIIAIICTLMILRLVIAFLKTLWGILPRV